MSASPPAHPPTQKSHTRFTFTDHIHTMWRRPPGAVWNGDRPMVSLKPMVGAARRMVECDRENDGRRLFTATAARSVCVPAPPGYHPVSSNRDTHGTKNFNISAFWRSVFETHARSNH